MRFDLTTFAFEVLNFLVLAWLLSRLVYKPLRRGIEARRAAMEEQESKVRTELEEAKTRRADVEKRSVALDEMEAKAVREASERAAEERARILEEAREDAAAERGRTAQLLEAEREAALVWARHVAVERGTEIAGRMLLDLAPDAIDGLLLERLLRDTDRLSAAVAAGRAHDGGAVEVEVTTARPLDEASGKRLHAALARVAGAELRFVARVDPELRAGLTVRVGERIFDASLAGQLEAFRERATALLPEESADA